MSKSNNLDELFKAQRLVGDYGIVLLEILAYMVLGKITAEGCQIERHVGNHTGVATGQYAVRFDFFVNSPDVIFPREKEKHEEKKA